MQFITSRWSILTLVLLVGITGPNVPCVQAQDSTYLPTPGLERVRAAVGRLVREVGRLAPGTRASLLAEGKAILDLEQRYFDGTMPIQRDIKDLDARIAAFNIRTDGTQAEANRLNDERSRLNQRVDADNAQLVSRYAAFAQSVDAAFANAPAQVSIDRIYVPSPETARRQQVQLQPRQWGEAGNAHPLQILDPQQVQALREAVREKVVNEYKDRILEHIPGARVVEDVVDQVKRLEEGYGKPTINLFRETMDDVRRAVAAQTSGDSSFADSQPIEAQRRHEEYRRSTLELAGESFKEGLKNAWKRDHPESETSDKPGVVPISNTPHPDAFRINRWLRLDK
jgi:hypothetical protein